MTSVSSYFFPHSYHVQASGIFIQKQLLVNIYHSYIPVQALGRLVRTVGVAQAELVNVMFTRGLRSNFPAEPEYLDVSCT